MKTLLLIPSEIKTGIEEAVTSDRHPRMDYFTLQAVIAGKSGTTCDIIGYAEVEESRHPMVRFLRQSVGKDEALAYLGFLKSAQYDAVFTNGENVGLPLALLWRLTSRSAKRPAHVTIGHRLSTGKKRLFFKRLGLHREMDAIFVYARTQEVWGRDELSIPADKLRRIAFHADEQFYRPMARKAVDPRQISAAGLEWRDYPTLIRAVENDTDWRVKLAAASPWSKHANETEKRELPAHIEAKRYDYAALRDLYAGSVFVVVPLYENDFQAGVTTLLEAMAMGKTVVVTRTTGQRDVVTDGENGIYVAPGDVTGWQETLESLRGDPERRERIGQAARRWVEENATLDIWAGTVADAVRDAVKARSPQPVEIRTVPHKGVDPWAIAAVLLMVLVLIPSLAANVYLYRKYSASRVYARTPDGKPVTYREYRDALEGKYGRETLRRLVLTRVISDAAIAAGVFPSSADVDAYTREVERTTPFVYEVQRLQARGSEKLLRQEMTTLLALENLRLRNVTVAEAEVLNWWRKYRERLTLPVQARTIMVATPPHDLGKAAKVRALLAGGIPPYLIAKEPFTRVVGVDDYEPDWENMPPEAAKMLNETIFRLVPGEIVSITTPTATYTIRLVSRSGGGAELLKQFENPPTALRDRVTRMAKLAKAVPTDQLLVKLYKDAKVTWEITPYSAYLSDLESAITAQPGRNAERQAAQNPAGETGSGNEYRL